MPNPIAEAEFKAGVYKAHQKHFDHVYHLHQIAQDAVLNFRTWTDTPYQASVSLIFARAFKSYDSVRRLCEIASCEDAAVILRSLLNLMAVTRWLSLESSVRARKYLHWYWVQMHLDAQRLQGVIPAQLIHVIEKQYQRVKHSSST